MTANNGAADRPHTEIPCRVVEVQKWNGELTAAHLGLRRTITVKAGTDEVALKRKIDSEISQLDTAYRYLQGSGLACERVEYSEPAEGRRTVDLTLFPRTAGERPQLERLANNISFCGISDEELEQIPFEDHPEDDMPRAEFEELWKNGPRNFANIYEQLDSMRGK